MELFAFAIVLLLIAGAWLLYLKWRANSLRRRARR